MMYNSDETAEEFLEHLFMDEYCAECHGDIEEHTAIPFLGRWFARCDYTHDLACCIKDCVVFEEEEVPPKEPYDKREINSLEDWSTLIMNSGKETIDKID